MHERMIDLETRLAFQEHALQTLSDVIARQQQEIDLLQLRLRQAEALVRSLSPQSNQPGEEEPPPPHY